MPLVTITVTKGKSAAWLKALADGVNQAGIETMNFPADDRYQIIHQVDEGCLELQGRSGDLVAMHLVMRAGRGNKQKRAFYRKVTDNLATSPGIPSANVLITITENHDIDWSFRDGVAQFVE